MQGNNLYTSTPWLRVVFIAILLAIPGLRTMAGNAIVIDSAHYSEVFGERRSYRIFLPSDYYEATSTTYPVVYFYHGWSQRFFGSLNRGNTEESEPTEEELISRMTEKYKIIVVKPDGYNANPDETYYLRPYNISPVETHRQFPFYFPELVDFIDQNYRTSQDRRKRGVTGYSMGGFMSFWLAGKYPHLVSAAGSFCGSPEFFVGPRDFPVEYYHGDMHGNYEGVRLRLNYGREDFIRAYHRDLDAIFSRTLDHYELGVYPGGHALSGLEDMFDFFDRSFQDPLPIPHQWNHIEVYPDFEVWGYEVTSDRDIPGFTVLDDVNRHGFRSSIRPFLPDGRPMSQFDLVVRTAPDYRENSDYRVQIYDYSRQDVSTRVIRSDDAGRLKIHLDGGLNEVTILKPAEELAIPVIHSVSFDSGDWPISGQDRNVAFQVLNKGNEVLDNAEMKVRIFKGENSSWYEKKLKVISPGATESTRIRIDFPDMEEIFSICKIEVEIVVDQHTRWNTSVVVPVASEQRLDAPFEIADGRTMTWLSNGKDTTTSTLGTGNGDGVANPGETIVIVIEDDGLYRLGQWFTTSPYVDLTIPGAKQSDNWTPFDYVGGSFKYNTPTIASNIPSGNVIPAIVQYWVPEYPDHFIKGGNISIRVSGEDITTPTCHRATISNDNILRVYVRDGGKVRKVVATLHPEDEPSDKIVSELSDSGYGVDRVSGDHIFSAKLDVPKFGKYSIVLEMTDEFGNTAKQELEDTYILYGQHLR